MRCLTLGGMRPFRIDLGIALAAVLFAGMTALAYTAERDPLSQAKQLIVVETPDWNAVDGRLQRFERPNSGAPWRPVGASVPIVVGRTGLAWGAGVVPVDEAEIKADADPVKKEGDGKAPAGVFSLGTAFGDAAQPPAGTRLRYVQLTPSVECVDDAASTHYNRVVDRSKVAVDWNSSEHMLSVGDPYRWGIVVGHNHGADPNLQPQAGKGSCIFLHIWRGPGHGTVGCTAMAQSELERLLAWLDPARKPLLVQLPAAQYERLKDHWKMPVLESADHR